MGFSFFGKKDKQDESTSRAGSNNEQQSEAENAVSDVLVLENILIGEKSVDKDTAIERAGQLLVDGGYVMPDYIKAMKDREKVLTTYIGNGIAIPHGVGAAKNLIIKSGISIIQYPQGVVFQEGKVAYLVVGIAGKENEHMKILTNLAKFIQEEEVIKELFSTNDRNKIYRAFTNQI